MTGACQSIKCDFVVVGVGDEPITSPVTAGVHIDNGIVIDEYCRTSIDGIFAAGDVANQSIR